MTFSIVIPAYNGAKYIEKAILSALSQTRKANEIIVYDDNSSDETNLICEKFKDRISYCYNSNGPSGFVNGWNQTILLAKSDFITILHQDDLLYPTFLEEAERLLSKHDDIMHLFSLCDYIDKDDLITNTSEVEISKVFKSDIVIFKGNEYVKAYQRNYNSIPHIHRCPGVITHRLIFEKYCKYNPEAGHIADDDFFYRVGQFTITIGIMKSLAAYRMHNDSETGKTTDLELVRRLAHDYIFQVKQWQDSDFIDLNEKKYFEFWAIKYLFQFNLKTVRTSNIVLKSESINLYKQFRELKLHNLHLKEMIKLRIIMFVKCIL